MPAFSANRLVGSPIDEIAHVERESQLATVEQCNAVAQFDERITVMASFDNPPGAVRVAEDTELD